MAPSLETASELASFDGVIGPAAEAGVPVTDPGLLHADGAFEVVRVYAGRVLARTAHVDRLLKSATNLLLDQPGDREQIDREISALLAARGGADFDGLLRIVLTRGGHRILITEPLPAHGAQIRLATVEYEPTPMLEGIKSLSYAANMLSGRTARAHGFDDALLVRPDGAVLEAPTSSFFYALGDGALYTPPLSERILNSITRALLLDVAAVRERSTTVDEVRGNATEAFIASTTREVQSVAAIDDREFGEPGPLTLRAATSFREHLAGWLE